MLQPRITRKIRHFEKNFDESQTYCNMYWKQREDGLFSISQAFSNISKDKILSLTLIATLFLCMVHFGAAQTVGEPYPVDPTPTLPVLDVTTVLLVNNGAGRVGDSHGRFLTVRPEVGLLTSTARTFIQDGITTEFATQVLGTTLHNGRIYAQYIKKSSRVLYENDRVVPSIVTSWVGGGGGDFLQTRSFLQNHNDLFNADAPDWQDIDDNIGEHRLEFVGNTDFVSVQNTRGSVLGTMETTSYLDNISTYSLQSSNTVLLQSDQKADVRSNNLNAQNFFSDGYLPTITVKNYFEQSVFRPIAEIKQTDRDSSEFFADIMDDGRSPKAYYQQEQHSGAKTDKINFISKAPALSTTKRILATVTYYGFADFTTIVGDSVIVFSPSTIQSSLNYGHVTSIKGKPTLRTESSNVSDAMVFEKIQILSTANNQWNFGLDTRTGEDSSNIIKEKNNSDQFSASKINRAPNLNYVINVTSAHALLSQSITTETIHMSSGLLPTVHPLEPIADIENPAQSTAIVPNDDTIVDESSIQVHGGATTVYIDDDPFANFVDPTVVSHSILLSTDQIDYETVTEGSDNFEGADASTVPFKEDKEDSQTTTGATENLTEDLYDCPLTEPLPPIPINDNSQNVTEDCDQTTSQVFLTQLPKSLGSLPLNTEKKHPLRYENPLSAYDIIQTTKYYCIQASQVQQLEKPEMELESVFREDATTEAQTELIPTEISNKTEESTVHETEDFDVTTDNEYDSEDDDYDTDNGSYEVDLIYKTLYTTYTYLTTFYQGASTTVSSHTEIVTNLISSTAGTEIYQITKPTDSILTVAEIGLDTASMSHQTEGKVLALASKFTIPQEIVSLLQPKREQREETNVVVDESKSNKQKTEYLNDSKYTNTLFTTYTYYTSIFADNDTDVTSRTEVVTNYITKNSINNYFTQTPTYLNTQNTTQNLQTSNQLKFKPSEDRVEKGEHVTVVMDVRSSNVHGNQQANLNPKDLVDDQVSSESNTEEIIPSATVLLQTSFTTFTFYTTMYVGDETNVISRLETVTNVATETLKPTKLVSVEEATFPVTYFTTFTYWTKLAKDGEITTLSREETLSNVIEPTNPGSIAEDETRRSVVKSYSTTDPSDDNIQQHRITDTEIIVTSGMTDPSLRSDLTTYYTTFTYYTTSYEVNETITNSHLETVTNVVTPTDVTTSMADTILITAEVTQPSEILTGSLNNIITRPSDLVLFDYKHIVDADEVSTLYFTTEVSSSLNGEGIEIEITSSTSSLHIDEMKKSSLAMMISNDESLSSSRPFKTGLVRLIEGTRIGNGTTTLYQSKVIGTVIDNRYAQIIESTSSFLFEKKTEDAALLPTSDIVSVMLSHTENSKVRADSNIEHEAEQSIIGATHNENGATALDPSETSKRTFAPVIRPFASRNRPTFAPKQKTLSPSSATIITRSDITPTITATPALKTSGRYSSSRRGVISNAPINQNEFGLPQSSRRTFGRPIKPSSSSLLSELSGIPQSNVALGPPRNRFASSSRTTQIVISRKQGINSSYRQSNSPGFRASGILGGNSKFRVKPTISGSPTSERTITKTVLKDLSTDISVEDENSTDELVQISDDEESARRNQNPLLRLRRPINRPSGFTPVPRSSVNSSPAISLRRNPLSVRAKTTSTTTTTTTTARPRTRSFQRPTISSLQARSRPQNSLFPPRGLFQTQPTDEPQKETKKNENDSENDSEYDDDDDADDEGEDDALDEVNRSRRSNSKSQKRKTLSRVRRQADTLNRSRFRFRRPSLSKMSSLEEPIASNNEDLNETTTISRGKISSRFGSRFPSPRGQQVHSQKAQPSSTAVANHRAIRPTRPTTPRTQFTLREKDATSNGAKRSGTPSNFRRQPSTGSPSVRRTIGTGTGTSRRLKSYSGHNNNNNADNGRLVGTSRARNGNSNSLNRGRGSVHGRNRNEYVPDLQSVELGSHTITVTHLIPAEVTVPVINGQITEYKNIVTAKTSTEVLGPKQYTEILGPNGQKSTYLTREESSINNAGVTELTRYLLHDSLTTTVTFTPTTIRGRKTSFSHILPSTVYSVEHVVSTVQPQISANAPLANILLSQLLLGNLNLPANPLIGALGQQQSAIPAIVSTSVEPVTEYRTHTSTYVTTIFDGKSTILPLTFQGKKILTTVYDTTAQTITATEYSVDTIVNTPIVPQNVQSIGPVAQVNSLLLQQLLLQQQQEPFSLSQGLSHTQSQQLFLSENLQDLDEAGRAATQVDELGDIDDGIVTMNSEMQSTNRNPNRKKSRKASKGHKRSKQHKFDIPLEDTSVVTLYISGRRPGEFSTVLSTVKNGYDHSAALQKRQAHSQIKKTVSLGQKEVNDMYDTEESQNVNLFVLPVHDHLQLDKNTLDTLLDLYHVGSTEAFGDDLRGRTASLESIVGDVDLWYSKSSSQSIFQGSTIDSIAIDNSKYISPETIEAISIATSYKNLFEGLEGSVSEKTSDEARYNLATHVMNGVELIIASEKAKYVEDEGITSNIRSRTISATQSQQKHLTLAPSTLKNQMILKMPLDKQEKWTLPINDNQIITKICLTTYTYRTTYITNGSTRVEKKKTVISNSHTEERNYLFDSSLFSNDLTLSGTPDLVIGMLPITYHFLNTLAKDKTQQMPIVITSKTTSLNPISGPHNNTHFLHPSDDATPPQNTNTYISENFLTKAVKDELKKLNTVTSKDILTQVAITEPMTTSIPIAPTFSKVKIKSNSKKTGMFLNKDLNTDFSTELICQEEQSAVHIFATKTFFTTFTFYTTFLNNSISGISFHDPIPIPMTVYENKNRTNLIEQQEYTNAKYDYETQVIENIITNTVASSLLRPELVSMFSAELMRKKGKNDRNVIVTMATLLDGQTMQVTAMKTVTKLDTSQIYVLEDIQPTVNLHTNHGQKTKAISTEKSYTINKISVKSTESIQTSPQTDEDLSLSESENLDVYPEPYIETNPLGQTALVKLPVSSTVSQIIGPLTLEQFRPMLNVMADLIKKNIANRHGSEHMRQTYNEGNLKNSVATTNVNHMSIRTVERPVYIPLQETGKYDFLSWHSYDGINNKDGSVDINAVSKSNIKSIRKHNSNHQAVKNVSFPRQAENSKKTYGSSLLRTGIPISPGEVITANADVIIGRPTMNVSLRDTAIRHNLLEMRNNLSVPKFYRQLIRSKTIYPSVPLIHPPKSNQDQLKMNRETLNDYGSILKPPPPINNQPASTFSKNVLQYPILLLAPSGLTQSRIKYPLSIPFEKNKNPSDNYYASQQIASLNSDLNSNEILEIMRIPEIFSTRLPAITKYLAISNTHDYSHIPHSLIYPLNLAGTPRTPLSASTYSGHHQVNLRKEMLSHTVNILAPPLTFKKEAEQFAHATAIRGHIKHSSMPLIKIPVNEAKVDVRVSPQINGIVLVQDKHASADSSGNKFKQRNQNLSNFAIGQPTTKAASESKASENIFANTDTPSTTTKYEISIKYKSLLGLTDKLYYNHSKAAEGFRHGDIGFSSEQDQKADYSNYSLQSYKPFYENNPENTSNMWLLMHHRKPFIISSHSPTVIERRDSNMITRGTDKIFLATGDNFHLGSLPKSEFYFELEKSKRTPQIQISINPFSIAKQNITVFVDAKKTVLEYSSQRANVYTTSTPENTTEKFPATLPPKHANPLESFSPLVSAGVQHFNTQQLSSNLEEVHLQNNRSEYNSSEQLKQDTKRLEPSEIVYDPFQTILKRTTELTNGLDSDSMKNSFLKPTHLIFIAPDNVPLLIPTTTTKSHTQEFLVVGVPFLSNTTSLDSSKFLKTSLIPTRKNTISVNKRSSTYSITSKKVLGKLSQLTDSKKHFQSRHPDQGIQIRSLVPDNTHILNATKTSHLSLFIGTKSESSLGILPTPKTILGMSKKKIGVQSDIFAQISQSASSLPQMKTTFSNPVKKKPSQILNGFKPETINVSTIIKTRPDLYQRATTKDSINSLTLLETSKITSVIEQNHFNSSLLLTHPVRDEERYSSIDSGTHISGILIDTPSKTKQIKQLGSASSCNPVCKLKKNEICVIVSDGDTSVSHCACRPSFGRMFPDRPCKPTYTYEMQMETMRVGNYILKFNDGLKTNASNEYRHLSGIILDAVDRMIMQSDFRDVYHGVQLISITASKQENILSKFLLQLSDNSDQMRLLTVFKKYLRQSNFSIGGTELYTSKEGMNSLQFKDFDECRHENFHDCSINANCFNLAGSYTCSCLNGYIDISDNAIYPGRRCSNNIIGCEKCNYHGKCITTSLDKVSKLTTVCQCLPWYAGTRCQLNLKILLICLIAIGAVLFILLLFCILIIHAKRKRECASANSTFMTASNIHPSVLTSSGKSRLFEYILDSHSESSYNSGSVLYKKGQGVKKSKMKPKAIQKENAAYKYKVTSTRNMYDVLDTSDPIEEPDFPSHNMEKGVAEADTDQDRSLTFMIPRAKFHQPYILKHSQLNNNLSMENKEAQRTLHKKGELEYRSVFIDTSKQLIKTVECSAPECITHTSALVSAGYEVSAIVNDPNVVSAMNVEIESHKNVKVDSESNGARSFDETTVEAVTAPVHFKLGMQIESHTNEEVNTMAERDLGSTFLLPHTHLYKPVKIPSEFSGFDSV